MSARTVSRWRRDASWSWWSRDWAVRSVVLRGFRDVTAWAHPRRDSGEDRSRPGKGVAFWSERVLVHAVASAGHGHGEVAATCGSCAFQVL